MKSLSLLNEAPTTQYTDPVCGMTVSPEHAAGTAQYDGQTYYFCSTHCLERFQADPRKYLAAPAAHGACPSCASHAASLSAAPAPDVAGPVEYTCPMHPEVVSDRPGACPRCGMALEPRSVSAEELPNPELADMTRRFWIGAFVSLPVFALAMADMLPGHLLHALDMRWTNLLQLVLTTPVVLWCGWPFFERAWLSLVHRSPNMFTLIALGVGAAFLYSSAATLFPDVFPEGFRTRAGAVEPYFDTAAVVTVLVLLGQVLELRARQRTSGAIRALLGLAPKTARLVHPDGREEDVPVAHVKPQQLLRVRPGERVSVDGVVVEGHSAVDESMISGEPIPVEKAPGAKLVGGTLNGTGSLVMRAERVGQDTLLAQIVRLVGAAQRTRAPIERLVNEVSAYFVPAVLGISMVTLLVWSFWGPPPRFAHALVNAVAVLIIACPCALGLATPMSIMVGTGKGAENGVLIRNAEALEIFERADTLVVDKTGTLTEGKPRLVAVHAGPGLAEDELLRLAASLERGSEHPLAAAIVQGAEARGLRLSNAANFRSHTGKGVAGTVDGHDVALGNPALLQDLALDWGRFESDLEARRRAGQTTVLVAADGQVAGIIAVADPLKPTTAEAICALHAEGMRIIMLTGDNRVTAEAIARQAGIDEVVAEVLPEQKQEWVRQLQAQGRMVAMAGDGVNDAPALAQAHVGIAMGTGTDVAIESAGITLVQGDLRGIVRARRLSHATMGNIRQNLFLAFAYNVVAVPVAAGVLYPLFGLLISPIWASAAMTLSSLSVVSNALRLRARTLDTTGGASH